MLASLKPKHCLKPWETPKIIDNRKYKLNDKNIEQPKPEKNVECNVKHLKKEDSF